MQNTNKEKKTLIKIRDLKQYFPVKGSKHEFVRANDGINLNIYQGETLGVVGESGCGKSTLGRVLLQLYHQTDGETMYYGVDRDEIAPKYLEKTYKDIAGNVKKAEELQEKAEKLQQEFEALENKTNLENSEEANKLYLLQASLNDAKRDAHRAFLNVAELIGGFYSFKDYSKVSELFIAHYKECLNLVSLEKELKEMILDRDDYKIRANQAKENNKPAETFSAKAKEMSEKVSAKEDQIKKQKDVIASKMKDIDVLRNENKDDPEFIKYEQYRDDGINLARLDYSEMRMLRNELQLIFQDPYSSLNPRMTVGQIIGEGLINHRFFKRQSDEMQKYVMKVMEDCGLQAYMIHRYPHQFSGGQRQRIGIARSLAVNPKFVVCDEAVSALDVSIQSQVINLLIDLKERDNLTYMFISHDLSVVKYISDRIAVMYLGNIVELSNSQKIFGNPLHPYTEALLAAIPTTDTVGGNDDIPLLEGDIPSPIRPPSGCKFHTRCRHCMDICKVVSPEFVEVEEDHFVACHYVVNKEQA